MLGRSPTSSHDSTSKSSASRKGTSPHPTAADVFAALVSDAAKECRVASGKLEDHDEQAPEHANEHDAGNEH